jgi:hypothetical protein
VPWNGDWRLLASFGIGNEFSLTRSEEVGTSRSRNSAHHVDSPASGKIENSTIEKAASVPNPMGSNRVDETRKQEGVNKVCTELATLGDRSRHNRRGCSGKDIVEVPVNVINPTDIARRQEHEICATDERVTPGSCQCRNG